MESGIHKSVPLITIAIPTWNRAPILRVALGKLLPQVLAYKTLIEVVISDNCSTDDTHRVISEFMDKFGDVNFVHFTQAENTGYYGNFRKCRELSQGKWFWLLSDNDFVNDDLVGTVIGAIHENEHCSAVYIEKWVVNKNDHAIPGQYTTEVLTRQDLAERAGYKLTLTSGVIIANDKTYDQDIFDKFKGNTFLGFAFFLSAMRTTTHAVVIGGRPGLLISDAKISFNVFTSFAIDMVSTVTYAAGKNFIDIPFEHTLMTSVILNNTIAHYKTYKIKGIIYGRDCGPIREVEKLLTTGFGKYDAFNKHITPLFQKSRLRLFLEVYLRKYLR